MLNSEKTKKKLNCTICSRLKSTTAIVNKNPNKKSIKNKKGE